MSHPTRHRTDHPSSSCERIVNIGTVVAIATQVDRLQGPEPGPEEPGNASNLEPPGPTVIFLNAGVLHRVGPHRLHVTLARALAAAGFPSLRIDLSGIGDSPAQPGVLSFRESAVADARAAMDQLHLDTGADQFILFGLCSGAENALAVAHQDHRVVALLLLDPPCYPTWRSRLRKLNGRIHTLATLKEVASWGVRVVSRRVFRSRIAPVHSPVVADAAREGQSRQLPADQYGRELSGLLDRGVKILCVYSGGNDEGYNHEGQLFEVFPALRNRVDVAYFPAANHVFTELAAREMLTAHLLGWCRGHFGITASGAHPCH